MNPLELIKILINIDPAVKISSIYINDNDIDIRISNLHEIGPTIIYNELDGSYNLKIGS